MKKVFGVGVNDVPNMTKSKCYTTWHSMIRRCYSKNYHKHKQGYKACIVEENWHYLSNFIDWFSLNYVEGWELDKDSFKLGNKIYSEDTCCFLPKEINTFLIQTGKVKPNGLPLGVYYKKSHKKYVAQISNIINGVRESGHILISEDLNKCLEAYSREKKSRLAKLIKEYESDLSIKAIEHLTNLKL